MEALVLYNLKLSAWMSQDPEMREKLMNYCGIIAQCFCNVANGWCRVYWVFSEMTQSC